jgi:hypothetical protein
MVEGGYGRRGNGGCRRPRRGGQANDAELAQHEQSPTVLILTVWNTQYLPRACLRLARYPL